jgi:hypothetical protein
LNSALLDFGTLAPGERASLTATVSNPSDCDLAITDLSFDDPAGPFTVGPVDSQLLGPGLQTTFDVTFAPTAAGTATGTLTLTSTAVDRPTVELTVIGVAAAPALTFEPASYVFDDVAAGCADTHAFLIENTGDAVLTVTSLDTDGGEGAFSVDTSGASPFPWSIAPDESVQVWVTFTPPARGSWAGSLVAHSDDPENPLAAASIDGTGTASGPCGSP